MQKHLKEIIVNETKKFSKNVFLSSMIKVTVYLDESLGGLSANVSLFGYYDRIPMPVGRWLGAGRALVGSR